MNFKHILKPSSVLLTALFLTAPEEAYGQDAAAVKTQSHPGKQAISNASPSEEEMKELKILQQLIAAGGDINQEDEAGWTPLHTVAYKGHGECVKLLLAAPGIDVNRANEYGNTPLILAAKAGHTECVKLLLAAQKIDIYKVEEDGYAPLCGVALGVKKMDENEEPYWVVSSANSANHHGNTALHCAAAQGHTEIVRLLIEAPGIDVNKANGWRGLSIPGCGWGYLAQNYTPLLLATANGQVECVKLLLSTPGIYVNWVNSHGETALHLAVKYKPEGNSECVKLLLAAPGIDVNKANGDGKTPLKVATERGHTACEELIRAAGGKM